MFLGSYGVLTFWDHWGKQENIKMWLLSSQIKCYMKFLYFSHPPIISIPSEIENKLKTFQSKR